MDSIREQIILIILDLLDGLAAPLPVDGEAAATVYRARKFFDPATGEVPAVSVFPQPDEPGNEESYDVDSLIMPIEVHVLALFGDRNPSELGELMLAELRYALGGCDPSRAALFNVLGELIDSIRFVGGGIEDYPDEDDQALVVRGVFNIEYSTVAGDPYHKI